MYSIVLMMALTGGAEQPALFGHGCHGCSGSCHGCSSSCHGGHGCHGCSSSCHGGHSCHGCHGGGLFSHHKSCHGCSGSCHGCSGSYGCSGGYGCSASYGSSGGYGCSGSSGCSGGYGAPVYESGPVIMPGVPPTKGPEPIKSPVKKGTETMAPAPATIVVSLPAEAKLTVDDAATKSTSATRVFASPTLQQGQEYYYTLKAEIVRDGKTIPAVKRVAVRAGEESRVSFEFPTTTSVAAK